MRSRYWYDVVAFENLRGHLDVAEDERAEALAHHGAYGGGHRSELFRELGLGQLAQRDHALGEVHGDVADAFEVVGDFEGGDDQAHLVVGEGATAQQADSVLVDDDLHFVDAWLEKENFAG